MNGFVAARQALLPVIDKARAVAAARGEADIADMLARETGKLEAGQLYVVVCGEFKSGKSSLINALLDAPNMLPTDVDIATSTVLVVRHGETRRARAQIIEDGRLAEVDIAFEDIARYAQAAQVDAVARKVRCVMIDLPNAKLAAGVVVVDTPGIASLDQTHSDATFAALSESDVILMASDVQRPLTVSELDFVEGRLLPLARNWMVVQTKVDRGVQLTDMIAANRAKLEGIVGNYTGNIPILGVSSLDKLKYLRTKDRLDLEDSGFIELEAAIWTILNDNGARRIIERAQKSVTDSMERMAGPLKAELAGFEREGSPEVKRLQAELSATAGLLDQLASGEATWRRQLAEGIVDIHRFVRHQMNQRMQRARHRLEQSVSGAGALADPERIGHHHAEDLKALYFGIVKDVATEVEDLRMRISAASGMELSATQIESSQAIVEGPPSLSLPARSGLVTHTVEVSRQLPSYLIGGSIVGGVLGGIIGGVLTGGAGALQGASWGSTIGSVLSTALGAHKGSARITDVEAAKIRQSLLQGLARFREETEAKAREELEALLTNAGRTLERGFEARIAEERSRLGEKNEALARSLHASAEEALVQRAILEEDLRTMGRIGQSAIAAAARLDEPPAEAPR